MIRLSSEPKVNDLRVDGRLNDFAGVGLCSMLRLQH